MVVMELGRGEAGGGGKGILKFLKVPVPVLV